MLFGKKYVKTLFFYNANPFRYARNNFTKFFSKWKSSLKINQMYLYVFLLSNYLDSFSRKGCLAMITIAIHKRFHTEIFARIVNKQPRSETGQHRKCYYMLFAVHRFFNSVKKRRHLLSLDKYFVK